MLRKLLVLAVTTVLAKKAYDKFGGATNSRPVADIKWRPSTPATADATANPLPRT